jgi:hypothetical protein
MLTYAEDAVALIASHRSSLMLMSECLFKSRPAYALE